MYLHRHSTSTPAPLRWALALALLARALGPAPAARAATTTAVDCNSAALLAALTAANASPTADTLDLAANCLYVLSAPNTYNLGFTGLPVIADATTAGALTIHGHGARLVRGYQVWLPLALFGNGPAAQSAAPRQAAPASAAAAPAPEFRLLAVAPGGELTIDSLTLENGRVPGGNGGAILNEGTLVLSNTTLTGNTAGSGGGIYSTGTLTVTASTFSDNTAASGGGAIGSSGDLTVNDSTFSGNAAALGESILVAGGTSDGSGNTLPANTSDTCPSFPLLVGASDEPGLIEAIHCANSSPSSDVINLTNSTYTFATVDNNWNEDGPNALPVIVDTAAGGALTINGNGATLARSSAGGTPEFRLLHVWYGGSLTLNNLTVQNGHLTGANGGGLLNNGTLQLTSSTVTGNAAFFGGGLINQFGTAIVISSTFSNNSSEHDGAGLASGASLQVQGSLFTHNVATGLGGGLVMGGGVAVITATQFISNSAHGFASGGGLTVAAGNLTLSESTIADNYGEGAGGGFFLSGNNTALLRNVTISNNGGSAWGGGIWSGGNLTLLHCTITGNSTGDLGGGGIVVTGGTLTLGHTIVSGNTALLGPGPDISGTVSSLGYNLIGNTAQLSITGNPTGNLLDGDAAPLNLGPLQDNGGPTLTRALLAGSVAIDKGNPSFAPPPSYDQRGVGYARVANSRIDIGAFEKQP